MKQEESVFGLNLNTSLFTGDNKYLDKMSGDYKPPKKREKVKTKKMADGNEMVVAEDLNKTQTNEPYLETYDKTNAMLEDSITEINVMGAELKSDTDAIRASKTLKKKYDYIAALSQTRGTLISTKITAIREMNKSTTDSHNLEMKRSKEFKLEQEGNDDQRIMDMYNAFITTPMGTNPTHGNIVPSSTEITMMNGVNGIMRNNIVSPDQQFGELNPVEVSMRAATNPDIKVVVMYDASTGNRWFDAMNTRTGEQIPGYDLPHAMFLEELNLDLNNGIARDTNLNLTYPIVSVGGNIAEY